MNGRAYIGGCQPAHPCEVTQVIYALLPRKLVVVGDGASCRLNLNMPYGMTQGHAYAWQLAMCCPGLREQAQAGRPAMFCCALTSNQALFISDAQPLKFDATAQSMAMPEMQSSLSDEHRKGTVHANNKGG